MENNNQKENIATGAQASVETMTTEEFHRLLEENTKRMNDARRSYQQRRSMLQGQYDELLRKVSFLEGQNKQRLIDAQMQLAQEEKNYSILAKRYKRDRNEAGCAHKEDVTDAKNEWLVERQRIINERHNIVDRYVKSGGKLYLKDDSALMWNMDNKKGGDDEQE